MSILKFKELDIKLNIDGKYLAHFSTDDKTGERKDELLKEHIDLVYDYFLSLVENNNLETYFDNLFAKSIELLLEEDDVLEKKEDFLNFVKYLFAKSIYWHDMGKQNPNFQIEKMKNQNNSIKKIDLSEGSNHSNLGNYLFINHSLEELYKKDWDEDEIEIIESIIYIFGYLISKHHGNLYKSADFKFGNDIEQFLTLFNIEKPITKVHKNENRIFSNIFIYIEKNKDTLFLLSKSLFSLLIISDYYATAQFMNYGNKDEIIYNDFGLINNDFKDKMYKELYIDKFDKNKEQISFNQELQYKKNKDFNSFDKLHNKNNKNLNHLRNKLFVEVRENLIDSIEKNLFYIEAPTGSGKTNLSIMSAIEIIKRDNSIKKIFYVFPFTTLITQTYDSIKTLLNLDNNQIVQLHSKAKYNNKKESEKDGIYGNNKTNFIDNQFMNYPITMLSHVKFFDILTGISKDSNYLFHRMANSIVIIDEIQTYNPNKWSNIVYLLNMFAKNFNIKFIVMSATLPKIGEILKNKDFDDPFYKLVTDKSKYFQNPNFAGRLDTIKPINDNTNESIYKKLIKESKVYKNNNKKVKTIIEFITKKGADQFYSYSKEQNNKLFDDILVLSGTILEPRRKQIIERLKDKTNNQSTLLVTTQVVEAGVDIDMDIGFKEKSLVDSDEQLAGRINRNSSKSGNKLFLFKMKKGNYKFIYKGDKRKNIKPNYENNEGKEVSVQDFDKFYSQVIRGINKDNSMEFIENLNSYIDDIKNLRFAEVREKTKIIDMKSLSIFVPLDLDNKFFKDDKELLELLNIYEDNISGKDVWKAYEEIIHNKEMNFIDKQIELKKFSSLLSKFTFSLADYHGSGIDYLKEYGKDEYGYLYLENYNNIYSFNNGLDTNVLKGKIPFSIF